MDDEHYRSAAIELLNGRASMESISKLHTSPTTTDDSYAIQDLVVGDAAEVGWKIGATSAFAQEFLGCDGPFCSPMIDNIVATGASIEFSSLLNPMMEPEIAVVLGTDLSAAAGPVTVDQARAATASLRPSIELIGGCFPDISACGVESLIADWGGNLGIVLGDPVTEWHDIDLQAVPVELRQNGAVVGAGHGADAMGGPMEALAWLANHLHRRGKTLRAGQIVTTGTCGGVAPLRADDNALATHGPLGEVSFTLV